MESKKINQLATELTPALSDLTIIGDPTTGISKKITLSQMASLFTGTVEEYPSLASFPLVGVADTIYIATDTNILYRWDTSLNAYAELSPNIVTSLVFSDANGFDGTISLVGSVATLTITTALTTGSVPFIGTSGALTQDNANLFFDDTNNRLGINTNSPTTALDVFGSGIIGRVNGTSTNNAFLGFASAGTNKWSVGNVQSDHRFRIYNEATTSELVSILQTGEFGIGIANPTTKLHIDGGASALIANLDANVSVAKSISFRSDNSNRINLEVSGTESGSNAGANFFIRRYSDAGALIDTPLTITRSTGNISFGSGATYDNVNSRIGIGISSPAYSLDVRNGYVFVKGAQNASGFIFENSGSGHIINLNANDTNAQLYTTTNTSLVFGTNNTNRAIITNAGNFGFGTLSPSAWNGNQGLLVTQAGTGNTNTIYSLQSGATSVDTGCILEGFSTNTTSGSKALGSIVFLRENTSTTTLSSYTAFYTNSGGTVAERVRIASNGLLSINETYSSANYKFAVKGSAHLTGTNNKGIFITDNATYTSIVGLNKEISSYNPIELRASGTDYQLYLLTNGNVEMAASLSVGSDLNLTRSAVTPAITYLSGIRIVDNNTGNGYSISSPTNGKMQINGSLNVTGTLTKGGGSFKISHPIPEKKDTHYLIHSFVESPKADLIYRGKINLKNGKATINIDEIATMTEGTFVLLSRDVQCFTTNESGFDLVKGKVIGNILNIESNNPNSTDEISYMVVAERNDQWLLNSDMVDKNGKLIVEIEKTQREIELENMDFSDTEIIK